MDPMQKDKEVVEDQHLEHVEAGSTGDKDEGLYRARTVSTFDAESGTLERRETIGLSNLRQHPTGIDATKEDSWSAKRWMLFVAMGFLWTGSQIPVYLYGGIIPYIELDIGGSDRYAWLLLAYLIPLASITPFVGPLADMFGRRILALVAVGFMVLGCIINSTAHEMNVFIGGMVFLGVGAGILELISLAVVGESAPTQKRGLYVGLIILTIVPYCPSVLWAQLVTHYGSWRWIGLWCAGWNLVGGILTAFFYWPPKRRNAKGLTRWDMAKRIDVTGGITSTAALTLFLMGLTWAGYQYPWGSPHVIASLVIGGVFFFIWIIWEVYFVKHPMFPRRLGCNPKELTLILLITFVSGANFFAVLIFWPTQYFVTWANYSNPISEGRGSLPVGFCIIGGSIIFSILITALRGKVKPLMIASTIIMMAGNGAMAAGRLDNLPGVYVAVSIACFGVGAVIVPCQVISTVVCPDDLIGTITACTISVRFVGGAVGYAIYYNLLRHRFTHYAYKYIVPAIAEAGVTNIPEYTAIATAIGGNLDIALHNFPGLDTPEKIELVVKAGQLAFSKAYPIVYYVSIAFGGIAVIASCFLPDVDKFMDNHIAVSYQGH